MMSSSSKIFKFIFIFTWISFTYSSQVTYTIPVHTIKTDEPYNAVFAEEDDELLVSCGQENIELNDIQLFYKDENNATKVTNPHTFTFKSNTHNGNTIICGAKSATTNETMTGIIRLLTIINKPFYKIWLPCEEKNYCYNHGQCYLDPENHATKICVCSANFAGIRCQNTFAGMHSHHNTIVIPKPVPEANNLTFLIIIMGLVLVMLFALGLAYYYRHNHNTEKKLRRHLICSQCNKERCQIKIEDESTQTPGGNVKTTNNHNKEYSRLPKNEP